MKRAPRGLDTPAGTVGQEVAAVKVFSEFDALDKMHASLVATTSLPMQNFYSLLTAFSIFLQTKKSSKSRAADGYLAKATALGYFSQVVKLLRERYSDSLQDSKRIAKIRDKMTSAIGERNLRANVQPNDALGCTVNGLSFLVNHLVVQADVATGLKNINDGALLTVMWHTFGKAIDTCFARKQQLSVTASGEQFFHIARIKTSVVQGVSIYKSTELWEQCMLHAFGMLFVCYDEPSEYLFPLVPPYAVPDLPGIQTYTQEEAVIFWESLQYDVEKESEQPLKRERKRPNIAGYVTEVMRDCLREMPQETRQEVTPNMTSHSLRRGAAAYANASPKLAIQWISTRGAWLLDSLTKAFAYIETTTREDQSVAKVLAGYESPDLPVATPSIEDLQERLTVAEFGQVITLRNQLYQHVLGSSDPRLNVSVEVANVTFAVLLMHMETVLATIKKHSVVAIARITLPVRAGASTCCEWDLLLATRWRTTNHSQLSRTVAGSESLLSSTLENVLAQLTSINDRIARIEDAVAAVAVRTIEAELAPGSSADGLGQAVPVVAAPATASTLTGSFLNWHLHRIWETVKGKKEQNKRAESKAAVNIMKVHYQAPCQIPAQPTHSDKAAHDAWKHAVWTLVVSMDRTANERLHKFDGKKPTSKASTLRKRWRALRSSHPAAYQALAAQYLGLVTNGSIVDFCMPVSHQWTASDLA